MMLLPKTQLENFKTFLDSEGVEHHSITDGWQILKLQNGVYSGAIYVRLYLPHHYEVSNNYEYLVQKFYDFQKQAIQLAHFLSWTY